MNITRNALLQLANVMTAPNFQNLQKRGQLPFPEGYSNEQGYSHPLGIVLALSEVAFKNTGMERDEVASLFRSRIGKVTEAYRTLVEMEEEAFMVIGLNDGEYEVEFGIADVIDVALAKHGPPECLTIINITENLKGLSKRYQFAGLII